MSLVLLHGFTGAPASWSPIIDRLRDVVVSMPALLGHADAPADARTWHEEIDRVAALVDARAPAHVVGYSMGGRVALSLALRHPSLVRRLTLVGAGPGIEDAREREARRDADEHRARALEQHGLEAFVRAWEDEPIFATQRHLAEDVRARQRAIRLSHRAEGLAASLRVLGQGAMPSLWGELERLDVPVQLVVGSEDAKLRGIAARMLERLPHATLRVVGGAGHDVGLERPDSLAALLHDPARPA